MADNAKKTPPEHLSDASRSWWASVVEEYELEPHHVHLLTLAAEARDRAEQARRLIEADGLIVATTTGGTKTHPAVAVERDSRIAFARLVRELDLDADAPEDRSRPPALRSNRPGYRN